MDHSLLDLRDVPDELKPLAGTIADLAIDLRWTWSHAGDAVWQAMDPDAWEQTENPHAVLQNLTRERLQELANNSQFKRQLQELAELHRDYRSQPGWYGETHAGSDMQTVAYFSMEFGLGNALPLYAGGLGVLAGDHLKAVSDMGVPLVAIGLLYQEGYFRQVLDLEGWQQEAYPYNDTRSLPVTPTMARSGAWLQIPLHLPGRILRVRVWEARVGRVTLYLLDSNDLLNSPTDRGITGKLYGGSHELRLVQEIVLGLCGWRLIEELGLPVDVCHLNEGHAAFVTLERARCYMDRNDVDYLEALWATRAGNVFTTHTPVDAGFDRYDAALLIKYGEHYAAGLGVTVEELLGLGRRQPRDSTEPFNMAYLAMRTCGRVNGVSRIHGAVSRRIFQPLYPRWPQDEIPVSHITNGVHVPSWDSVWADRVWTEACGKARWLDRPESLSDTIATLDDEALWTFRGQERADLIDHARNRLARQLGQRGADAGTVAEAGHVLDPNVLTLGFARRFTEYKRPNLLLQDPERLQRLLTDPERPMQIIIAGKAHPEDELGKRLIHAWIEFLQRPGVRRRAVFLEDYDIGLAQEMVQGVDVWINTPRRPWEASGTSGMKVLANGGLNLSELDGWWAEAYAPDVGWALGDGREHPEPGWDAIEAGQLYRQLEEEIVPLFYRRDSTGIPRDWIARIRASMARLAPSFSTSRMVMEYVQQMYLPAARAYRQRCAQGNRLVRELRQWESVLERHWGDLHFGNVDIEPQGERYLFRVQAYLGEIPPEFIQVQLYADAVPDQPPFCAPMERVADIPGAVHAYVYELAAEATRPMEAFTARVVPWHPAAGVPAELALILWQK